MRTRAQRNEARPALPETPAKPGTLRWYWNGYKQSDHWLGDLSVGHEGLAESTRLQRTGLIESLLPENGEKPFAVLTRKVIKAEMKARPPSQAANLLSAVRGNDPLDDRREASRRRRRSDHRTSVRQGKSESRDRRLCSLDGG